MKHTTVTGAEIRKGMTVLIFDPTKRTGDGPARYCDYNEATVRATAIQSDGKIALDTNIGKCVVFPLQRVRVV